MVNRYSTSSTNAFKLFLYLYHICIIIYQSFSSHQVLADSVAFSSSQRQKTPPYPQHFSPTSPDMGETPQAATVKDIRFAIKINVILGGITFNRKSLADLYGCLNAFLCLFPALKLLTFRQSNSLSNISTKRAVSAILSPPVSLSALLTESLKTCYDV